MERSGLFDIESGYYPLTVSTSSHESPKSTFLTNGEVLERLNYLQRYEDEFRLGLKGRNIIYTCTALACALPILAVSFYFFLISSDINDSRRKKIFYLNIGLLLSLFAFISVLFSRVIEGVCLTPGFERIHRKFIGTSNKIGEVIKKHNTLSLFDEEPCNLELLKQSYNYLSKKNKSKISLQQVEEIIHFLPSLEERLIVKKEASPDAISMWNMLKKIRDCDSEETASSYLHKEYTQDLCNEYTYFFEQMIRSISRSTLESLKVDFLKLFRSYLEVHGDSLPYSPEQLWKKIEEVHAGASFDDLSLHYDRKKDVKFLVEGKPLFFDKELLCQFSPVFKTMFNEKWCAKKEEVLTEVPTEVPIEIPIDDFTYASFSTYLSLLTEDTVKRFDYHVFDVLEIAHLYDTPKVTELCSKFLLENMDKYERDSLLSFAVEHGNLFKVMKQIEEQLIQEYAELWGNDAFIEQWNYASKFNLGGFLDHLEKRFRKKISEFSSPLKEGSSKKKCAACVKFFTAAHIVLEDMRKGSCHIEHRDRIDCLDNFMHEELSSLLESTPNLLQKCWEKAAKEELDWLKEEIIAFSKIPEHKSVVIVEQDWLYPPDELL